MTEAEQPSDSATRRRSKPFAPLLARDRAFLREYVKFGYMHHVVATEALRSAYERYAETAGAVRMQVERVDRETGAVMAAKLNDGARVPTVVVARLLSEFAAAVEDLGALMLA